VVPLYETPPPSSLSNRAAQGRRVLVCALLLSLLSLLASACAQGVEGEVALSRWELEQSQGPNVAIELPVHLDEYLPKHEARYRLRTEVELPIAMQGQPLTLGIRALAARAKLRVNGAAVEVRHGYGVEQRRSPGTHVFRIPAELTRANSLNLELTVQHRWGPSGWLDSVPSLTPTLSGKHPAEQVRTVNEISQIGGLIALWLTALMYSLVWALDRQQKAHGWFALQALAVAVHPMFALGLTQPVFGVYETSALGASLISGLTASVYFTSYLFDLPRPHRAWAYQTVNLLARGASGTTQKIVGSVVRTRPISPSICV
jgi:hypothetical protein